MTRRLATALSLLLVLSACGQQGAPSPDLAAGPTVVPLPSDLVPGPTPTPTPTPTATPTPTPSPTEDEVTAAQQRLADLGYYIGTVDGAAGPATASAVMAFQKVQGLGADGVIGPNTLAALADPVIPSLRGGPANRIEVDLDTQVLYLVEGGTLARVLPISSGSGDTYSTAGGGTARSVTPTGTYRIERHISGERHAALGTLYDPMYFYRGWAIHGSNSVPAYPASHGCVRVTRADAKWLFDRAPIGMTVTIYGSTNSFDPASESAGTAEPAGDTPDTLPPDGIQTEEPAPATEPPATGSPTPEQQGPTTQPTPTDPTAPGTSTPPPPEPGPTPRPATEPTAGPTTDPPATPTP